MTLTTSSPSTRHVEHVMGIPVTFAFRGPLPGDALRAAIARLHEIDARFSTYKHDSEVNRLDRGELAAEQASDELWEVLVACEALREATGGRFDAWAARGGERPQLDPSGYVKGWAVDEAAGILADAGEDTFFINAGGDVLARASDDELPWRIGIRHPTDSTGVAAVVAGRDLAVATSAAYERGDHIIDPLSGHAPAGLLSLTVTGTGMTLVDAYATAAFAMGADGPAWVAAKSGFGVFAVLEGGAVEFDAEFESVRAANA